VSLAFLDTETVTLEPGPDVVWEIGIITRDGEFPDQEWRFQLRPNMARAEDEALRISRFHERYELAGRRAQALAWSPVSGPEPATMTFGAAALTLHTLLAGRSIFGICPAFDTLRLGLFLRKQWGNGPGYRDPFHYQPHDVEDEVAGYLRGYAGREAPAEVMAIPRPTKLLAHAIGIDVDAYELHTALGDARLARDLHDVVENGGPF
jgi:hypothetical protein